MMLAHTPAFVAHDRPAEDEADDLLHFQRVMLWLRLLGVAIIVTQGWLYTMLSPVLLGAAVGLAGVVIAVQTRLLAPGRPLSELRRRSLVLLAADMLVVYLIGTNFTADAEWLGFYFYPLLSLEAAIITGVWAGLAVTMFSVVVYLAQLVLHIAVGHTIELRSALGAVSLVAMTGGFMAVYAHLAGRGRDHLRAMVNLTSALVRHERQADALEHLDRRLYAALGARVRSIAVREEDGGLRLVHWRSAEERSLTPAQARRAMGDDDTVVAHLEAGEPVTLVTDPWSVVTATLGLPDWASAVTLVPIVAEGRWAGLLPVLWPTHTVPDRDTVRLLNGLAGQIGLARARDELERMRRDATVDPATGLLNRRAVGAELEAFVARAARSGGRLAVLLCELDCAGPAVEHADATMRAAAAAVLGVLRSGDVAGHHDDDRILIVAADAGAPAATALGARISGAVAAMPGGDGLRVAIGAAVFPEDGARGAELVEVAEASIVATAPRLSAPRHLAGAEAAAAL